MDTFFIPNEEDFKRWIREALVEYFRTAGAVASVPDEPLLSRVEAAALLDISLVTLTDWVKRGLPSHKQRGRVYFTRSGIMTYLKAHHLVQLKFGKWEGLG
jgi:Helix-turn-helix domain